VNTNHIRLCYRFTYPSKPIDFSVRINNIEVLHCCGVNSNTHVFDYNFNNQAQNRIEFVVSGKTKYHTILDNNGNILNTSQVEIEQFDINNTDILDLAYKDEHLITYDYVNDNNEKQTISFDPILGFNGVVTYTF